MKTPIPIARQDLNKLSQYSVLCRLYDVMKQSNMLVCVVLLIGAGSAL